MSSALERRLTAADRRVGPAGGRLMLVVVQEALAGCDATLQMIDATIIRAHHYAGRRRIARSRLRGLATKINARSRQILQIARKEGMHQG
jgi:hypothetical protein